MAKNLRIDLTAGDDYYRGGDTTNDRIFGYAGDDDIDGRDGDDYINGGAGNDILDGGHGNDTLIGGAGIDAANYQGATSAVMVDLGRGFALDGYGGADNLYSIEVVLGSAFGDAITGGAGDDDLRGGAGGDTIDGGAGNDVLRGDAGHDILNGGDGFDYVDYFYTDGVKVDLEAGVATVKGDGTDEVYNMEGVLGSRSNDIIFGSLHDNDLRGEAGDDRIDGRAGNDNLAGESGNDFLTGGAGNDVLYGGSGSDRFVFADGDAGTSADATDRIMDFSHADGDRIDLHFIDARTTIDGNQAFMFIGEAAFSGRAGQLNFVIQDGNTFVQGDTNGDKIADFVIAVAGEQHLTVADFLV